MVTLHDDECLLDRNLTCTRKDEQHHREQVEMPRQMCEREPRMAFGRCLHRHTVGVESVVTGEVVAHLCTHCDAQLP